MGTIELHLMDKSEIRLAQEILTEHHYRHAPVDPRCSVEGYEIQVYNVGFSGYLIFGRPEATRCQDWYGNMADFRSGRCECTYWQVLNLARVWIIPELQPGGAHWEYWGRYVDRYLPGFWDRKGVFRSTLASDVLKMAVERVGFDYMMRRPPCFLDEPYEIQWLLSYCDPAFHKGTIYKAAGFNLHHTNEDGLMTWRIRLPALTPDQDQAVRDASMDNPRSRSYRAKRAQLCLPLG